MVLSMNKSAVCYKSFTSRMSVIHPSCTTIEKIKKLCCWD
jgi:hypothetical protein